MKADREHTAQRVSKCRVSYYQLEWLPIPQRDIFHTSAGRKTDCKTEGYAVEVIKLLILNKKAPVILALFLSVY